MVLGPLRPLLRILHNHNLMKKQFLRNCHYRDMLLQSRVSGKTQASQLEKKPTPKAQKALMQENKHQ